MRRAVVIGLAGSAVLVVLGLPFLGVKWGFPDDRVLPGSASAHQVGDRMREGFAGDSATAVTIVVPDADGLAPAELERYAATAVAGRRRLGGQLRPRVPSSAASGSVRRRPPPGPPTAAPI